jgi:hypothetical protein
MRPLDRLRLPVEIGDRVETPIEAGGPVAEQAAQDRDRFQHPADPHRGGIERQAERKVLGLVPAGPDPHDEPSLAQHVDRRKLLGEHRGMAQVVVEDERTEAQPLGRHRHGRQQRDRRQLRRQVIVNGQVAEADRLGGPGALDERAPILHAACADQEPEGLHGFGLPVL